LPSRYNFSKHYACRGTSLIGVSKLSRYRIFIAGTGAVSRYKLSRSQKSVKVQDFNCGQMRVSGCNNHYKFVLSAGTKAKSVTNNLPILSVLYVVIIYFVKRIICRVKQIFLEGEKQSPKIFFIMQISSPWLTSWSRSLDQLTQTRIAYDNSRFCF
jgi:hypothetical protein